MPKRAIAIIRALSKIGDKRAISVLKIMKKHHPDKGVKSAAHNALVKLGAGEE